MSVVPQVIATHRGAMADDDRHAADSSDVDDLITVEQAATIVGRSVATVWRALRAGRLRAVRVMGRTRVHRREALALAAPIEIRIR